MSDLSTIEATHGFQFGPTDNADSAGAAPTGSLSCPNQECGRRGRHTQIHEDTILPVHCGECHTVLLKGETTDDDVSRAVLETVSPEVLDQLIVQLEKRKRER